MNWIIVIGIMCMIMPSMILISRLTFLLLKYRVRDWKKWIGTYNYHHWCSNILIHCWVTLSPYTTLYFISIKACRFNTVKGQFNPNAHGKGLSLTKLLIYNNRKVDTAAFTKRASIIDQSHEVLDNNCEIQNLKYKIQMCTV